jgi:2-haloacid dehalogenase
VEKPTVMVFDVNETLSDMSPMASRFIDLGAPGHAAELWFTSVLRDGFALTAAGNSERLAVLGEQLLRVLLPRFPLNRPVDDAVGHIMSGFMELSPHPDVVNGVRALSEAGIRLVTLSNGSTDVAEGLLTRAGVREEFEQLLSVEEPGVWKPARRAYEYAARACGVDLSEMLLVAVHPWDIDGAARAGLSTAWVNRADSPYPSAFTAPTHTVTAIDQLAELVAT